MIHGARQKSLFHAEMAKLLEAGFDIRKAAGAMRDTRLPAAQEALLDDLLRGLDEGKTIAGALAADRAAVSELERRLIEAGERGGRLAQAFRHLADYYSMIASARGEMIKGMIYPIVILHLGVLIGSVPGSWMLGGVRGAEVAVAAVRNLLVVYVLAAGGFFLVRRVWSRAAESAGLDRAVRALPWIGKARRDLAMARFCHVYHACLLSGTPVAETARMAAAASRSGLVRQAGAELAATARAGQPLGPVFRGSDAFPKPFSRSYATAEESGSLDTDLARWAAVFQSDAAASIRTMAAALPKVLYVLILLYVGWKIAGFYLEYYQELGRMLE